MTPDELSSRVRLLHIRSRRLVENLFAGNYHSVFKGPGLEFDDVRNYEYGDDVRFIDWNVSSRMASPYSKTFREERELVLFMVMDVSASLTLGGRERHDKREMAGNLFALLALAALANNDRVGSLLFSDKVERLSMPTKNRHQVLSQISALLSYPACTSGSDLSHALQSTAQTLKRRSIIVILSDFRMEGYKRNLNLLSRKHDVIAIRLSDNLDKDFPPVGLVELKDPESSESFMALGRSKTLRRHYGEFWEEKRREWLDICHSAAVDTLEVDSAEEAAESLMAFFRRRRRL